MTLRFATTLWSLTSAVALAAAVATGVSMPAHAQPTPASSRPAAASFGLTELPGQGEDGPITVFYPSSAPNRPVARGVSRFDAAQDGAPVRGNGRLVVISHGSGGSPWTQADLARRFVAAGFVVAMPEHRGDNWHDTSLIGPPSWKLRPFEVSRAIDTVLADPRFGPLVDGKKVGMYGMSAGGHTALALAGGQWSPSLLLAHCREHLDDDFASCVGPSVSLSGGWSDAPKKWVIRTVLSHKLGDTERYGHTDPRIVAILAEVPFAADFDMGTLARPAVPLGLMRNGADPWLVPRFHIDRVLVACDGCERVSDLPRAGHGSLLELEGLHFNGPLAQLLADPPGFDRAQVGPARDRIVQYFERRLAP